MLFRDVIDVYCEGRMKHRDIECVKMWSSIMVMGVLHFQLLMFLAPSVHYNDHCALEGLKENVKVRARRVSSCFF